MAWKTWNELHKEVFGNFSNINERYDHGIDYGDEDDDRSANWILGDWDINSEPVEPDRDKKNVNDIRTHLKGITKDISFPVIKMFGDDLFIMYFVECSSIQVKSMIHLKLKELLNDMFEIKLHIKLKQIGHNFN